MSGGFVMDEIGNIMAIEESDLDLEKFLDFKEQEVSEAFAKWKQRPEIAFMIDNIVKPASPEGLEALLKSVFDAGLTMGRGVAMGKMIKLMMGGKRERVAQADAGQAAGGQATEDPGHPGGAGEERVHGGASG